jgi:hypothetical protein
MKLLARFAVGASVFAVSAMAESWTGTISDGKCGMAHADASEKSQACVKACVKRGGDAVFVVGDKVLKIDAASKAKIEPHLGHKVVIDGSLADGTVTVASIKMAE